MTHKQSMRIKTVLRKNSVKTTTDSYAQLSNSASAVPTHVPSASSSA
jgi:hypothetical protein